MTRRNFIRVISGTLSTGLAALCCIAEKVLPRRFTRAVRCNSYPGPVNSKKNIKNVGKWSG
ncbi:MAG TPA: hypothetical protein HPP87_10870 [Planctomycetes bacterium]|nr:hypothetical protein [Planctomycetota bacterium]